MTSPSEAKLKVFADPEVLARRVADCVLDVVIAKDGNLAITPSGGSRPGRLYEFLAGPPYRDFFPWSRTYWFWGDKRFVTHDDKLSNHGMVGKAMLSHVPIPEASIHLIPTQAAIPEAAASTYERVPKSFYGAGRLDVVRPLFDVVLLGMGLDGHEASLFPRTSVLAVRDRWVAAIVGAKSGARVPLSYPLLESSQHVVFLVMGEEKRAILSRFRRGDSDFPASHLHPSSELIWFMDRDAARFET
jgi:6-phosphogluconolactonase